MCTTSFPQKLKDPRTCRVFVSSPFGGIEREREELVARYFPQLTATCQAKGVQFVAVDMRWGITEKAASDNQVVNICLREIDRCDIFIGLYGQRYGWHGVKDKQLQQNINLAAARYPWLKKVRDRSVTELEFMHGFLNSPGTLPAAFAFRHKSYDEERFAEATRQKDEVLQKKYAAESPGAKELLDQLKQCVLKAKSKCLAIHEDYKTPQEAAQLLFEDMKKHLETVLLKDTTAQTPRDLELACHDAAIANRTSLYVGGQGYFKQLDNTLKTGGTGHVIVGPAGSGKGALLSNWLMEVKKMRSHRLVYHFVGCSRNSTDVREILKRVTEELEIVAGVLKKRKRLEELEEEEEEAEQSSDLSALYQKMVVALDKASKKKKIAIVIDGLSRVQQLSRTSKTLFWLPTDLPKTVNLVVTCREEDTDILGELTKNRGYTVTKMQPLTLQERKDFCVGVLKQYSKELSPAQLDAVVTGKLSQNPLFLRIVTTELCAFGDFLLLGEKIDSMMKAQSITEMFDHFLGRLEEDYNIQSGRKSTDNLIEQVMCGLALSRKGLNENELRDMFHVPSAAWSPLYFALKDFFLDHSGLLRLAFAELHEAVEKRYLSTEGARDKHLGFMINYFQKQRKSWPPTIDMENASVARVAHELPWLLRTQGNKDGLIEVLTDIPVFGRLFIDEEYELLELWRSTGRCGEEIAKLHMDVIVRHSRRLDKETKKEGARKIIDVMMLSYLDALTYILEMGHFSEAQEQVLHRRLQMLEKLTGSLNEDRRQRMLSQVRLKLSYLCANSGRYQEAEKLQQDVLAYRQGVVDKSDGAEGDLAIKDLAACFHAMGLLHSRTGDFDKAIMHYQKAMGLHEKLKNPVEYADSMNNLGVMLMKRGNYEQAAQLCSKALKIYEEEYFGHLPPIIGVMTGNIAVCYRNLNRLDESEEMYKKAIEISQRALGHDHPNVAAALTNLGTLEVNRHRFHDAEEHFAEALAIHKVCATPYTNNDLFKAREKYVFTLIKRDKLKEALETFRLLYDQGLKGEHLSTIWPVVWVEVLSLLLSTGQTGLASSVAGAILAAGARHDVIYTLLHKADRACHRQEARPRELTLEYAMQQFPKSPVLIKYQAQEVLIPSGDVQGLITLLDRAEKDLGGGSNIYHVAMSWCQEKGKTNMVPVILQYAADKFHDDLTLATLMAQALREAEKFQEASVYALRMLNMRPEDPNLLLCAGEIMLRAGNTAKGRSSFEKVLRLCKPDTEQYIQAKSGLKIADVIEKEARMPPTPSTLADSEKK